MNGKKIEWGIIITDEDAPISSYCRYAWKHTNSAQDPNCLVEGTLWRKIAFRRSTI